jgi:hypothetical protein
MRSVMIEAIRIGDSEIMNLFGPSFSSALKWTTFLDQYFGPGALSQTRFCESTVTALSAQVHVVELQGREAARACRLPGWQVHLEEANKITTY